MRTLLTLTVISSLLLSGCSGWRDSRANPANWFGNSRSSPVEETAPGNTNPLIPERTSILRRNREEVYAGTPVDQVTSLTIERKPGGAIVRASGLSARQGAHDVRLTSETDGDPVDGVLTFTLEAIQPADTPRGSRVSRSFNAARFVSRAVLERVDTIRVVGGRNVQTTRR